MAKFVSMDLNNSNPCILQYTTTDGEILHFNDNAFEEKIISHTYTNKGMVIFEKPIICIHSTSFFYKETLSSITIPDSVTEIGDSAFEECTGLISITIPNSVTEIGERGFDGCTSLKQVTIGNSVTSIGESAFSGCTSLTNITIPDSVTKIGEWAFSGCTSLTNITIPDSVTKIGERAFSGCSGLINVTIGKNVIYIGEYAFYGCDINTIICRAENPPRLYKNKWDEYPRSFGSFETLIIPTGCEDAYYQSNWGRYISEETIEYDEEEDVVFDEDNDEDKSPDYSGYLNDIDWIKESYLALGGDIENYRGGDSLDNFMDSNGY